MSFAAARGILDSVIEDQVLPVTPGSPDTGAVAIIQQARQQGIPLAAITANSLPLLTSLGLPADAVARITTNVQNGLAVLVPTKALTINGIPTTAWLVINPVTGEWIAQGQDGGYQSIAEYAAVLGGAAVFDILLHGLAHVAAHNPNVPPIVPKYIEAAAVFFDFSLAAAIALFEGPLDSPLPYPVRHSWSPFGTSLQTRRFHRC